MIKLSAMALAAATSLVPTIARSMPLADKQLVQQKLEESTASETFDFVTVEFRRADGLVRDSARINTVSGEQTIHHLEYDEGARVTFDHWLEQGDEFWTRYQYDADGRKTRRTDSTGAVQAWGRDATGRVVTWFASGPSTSAQTSTTSYSDGGRLAVETRSTGVIITTRRDDRGNLLYYRLDNPGKPGVPVIRTFNSRNQITSERQGADGVETTYVYNDSGLLLFVVRAGEVTRAYGYDRQSREISQAGGHWRRDTVYDDEARTRTVRYVSTAVPGDIPYETEELTAYDELGREVRVEFRGPHSKSVAYIIYDR